VYATVCSVESVCVESVGVDRVFALRVFLLRVCSVPFACESTPFCCRKGYVSVSLTGVVEGNKVKVDRALTTYWAPAMVLASLTLGLPFHVYYRLGFSVCYIHTVDGFFACV